VVMAHFIQVSRNLLAQIQQQLRAILLDLHRSVLGLVRLDRLLLIRLHDPGSRCRGLVLADVSGDGSKIGRLILDILHCRRRCLAVPTIVGVTATGAFEVANMNLDDAKRFVLTISIDLAKLFAQVDHGHGRLFAQVDHGRP